MKYLAHISEDGKREQSIKDHLEGTAELAANFAAEFGYEDWGYCCGLLHDIGKYSVRFQERLHGSEIRVDHATAGAQVCNSCGGYYNVIGYCVAGHHAGLADSGGSSDASTKSTYAGRMKKKLEDYQNYQKEIKIPELKTAPFAVENPERVGFVYSFFIRMLYSCLVDADYLDTENFMQDGQIFRQEGETMAVLWEKMQTYVTDWLKNEDKNTINGRRTEILRHCIEMGKKEKGIYRLTVPTGGGKTAASLAFALQHAVEHNMKHIIYVIPYMSIIEQNAQVFRNILGEENVLEHHCGVDFESTEELHPMQLAAENWDKPVIVTTNVQFFESLFSNKSSKCRKLHNIANSIIIFDEAQMLPNDYLKPCVAVIEELVRHYRSSVVLCTATQPTLGKFFSGNTVIRELCPHVKEQFEFFKRTTIRKLGNISRENLAERLRQEKQALCILNTKREVQQIYELLQGEGVYHLSTLMYPVHRKRVLNEICHMQAGKKCIVISTSLVEAGVDLDFQTVYRQLAGIDSMIQAAGRCNREGKRELAESNTYIFQLEEVQKVPGQEQQIDTSKMVLREYDDISSLEAIEIYFERLYNFRGNALDKKQLLQQFEEEGFVFAKIARQFKLIEQDTKTIFIPKEERAKEILEELRIKGATRKLMREAGQYCVNVYDNIFQKIYGAGMVTGVTGNLNENFFVLRDCDNYSEEEGLQIDAELGSGIWF